MNGYVRELVSSLAQAGVEADVVVRRWDHESPDVVDVEPGFRVVHVDAGPVDLVKEQLPDVVDAFAAGVEDHLRDRDDVDALHANYWLSGVAGHQLKHALDLPLVSTFRSEEHTSELQSLMRISYAVFCLKKKKKTSTTD